MTKKLVCLVATGVLAATTSIAQTTSFEVGDKAPDFELPDASGKNVKLSDFEGEKLVVLEFFRSGDW